MKRAGFHRDDPVFPDLAYSLPLDSYRLDRASRPAGLVVGLSPFCHRHPLWPLGKNRDYSAYEAYIRMMVAIVQWLVAKGSSCRCSPAKGMTKSQSRTSGRS